jgi:hypothetical protein
MSLCTPIKKEKKKPNQGTKTSKYASIKQSAAPRRMMAKID